MKNPAANELIIAWINTNTKYKATLTWTGNAIKIMGRKQIAWLYLELYDRWGIKPGLYFLTDMINYDTENWPHKVMPPLGDPDYFSTLVDHLNNGPKPF